MRFSANAFMPSWRSWLANARGFERLDLLARPLVQPLLLGHDVQRTLVALHRERCGRRDLAREVQRVRECVAGHVLHQPQSERFFGVDVAAREQEVPRGAVTDEHRQAPDVARAEMDAEATARDRQARAHRRDPDVARDRELHPRPDRRAVDRGDDGRRVRDDRVEHLFERGPERVDGRGPVGREAGDQIRAGAERRARAGDDDRPQLGVRLELHLQLVAVLAVEGVAPLVAIDRRQPHEAARFEVDHGCQDSSMRAMRSPSCTVCPGST